MSEQHMGDGLPEHRPVQLRPFPVHRNPAYNEIPSRRGVNGWAVASLILGLGGAMVGGFVAGIVALAQVKDRPQKGRGLAIAGLIFSAMWTLLFGIAILVGAIRLP